jgi:hypothetical protein
MNSFTKNIREQLREAVKHEIEEHGEAMSVERRTMYSYVELAGFRMTIYYDGTVQIFDPLDKIEFTCTRTKLRREISEMSGRDLFWLMVRAETERRTIGYLKKNHPMIQKCFYA